MEDIHGEISRSNAMDYQKPEVTLVNRATNLIHGELKLLSIFLDFRPIRPPATIGAYEADE